MPKDQDMLEEYDFSAGIQGKYSKRYNEGTNVVVIESDVMKYFLDHDLVNQALRSLSEIIEKQKKLHNKAIQRIRKASR
jgi:urate oxidase